MQQLEGRIDNQILGFQGLINIQGVSSESCWLKVQGTAWTLWSSHLILDSISSSHVSQTVQPLFYTPGTWDGKKSDPKAILAISMANGDISKMPQMTQSPHGQCMDADNCSVTFSKFFGPSIAMI